MGRMKERAMDLIEDQARSEEISYEIAEIKFQSQYEELTQEEREELLAGCEPVDKDVDEFVESFYQEYIREQVAIGKKLYNKKGA
jgi:chorismate mutase